MVKAYEAIVIPPGYDKHIHGNNSTCIRCSSNLEMIDEFLNHEAVPMHHQTEYESTFSICSDCSLAHIELLDWGNLYDFEGPLLISW